MALLQFTDKGIYCAKGNFYIDPWKPVAKAIITHGHSDHAKWGCDSYLCHTYTKPILQLRLGQGNYESIEWNTPIYINGVMVSLHPAGHIIGAAQVRVAYQDEVWVCSGDYKVEDDGISGAYEPIKCNHFITECTFGLPIYKWKPQATIYSEIQNWVLHNQANKQTSVLIAYSLGKAQRVLDAVYNLSNTIYAHGAIYNVQQLLVEQQLSKQKVTLVNNTLDKTALQNAIVIAPPSADGTPWMKKFTPYRLGICSGWMQVRGNARRRNADAGFALSDHCDWDGLLTAVKATGAEKVYATHGFTATFSKYLNEIGKEAVELHTQYGVEEEKE